MSESITSESVFEEVISPKAKKGRPSKAEQDLNQLNIEIGKPSAEKVKPKVTRAKKQTAEELQVSAKNIQGIHMMIAMITKAPEVTLSDSEAISLASALERVSQEYGLAIDGKTGAFLQLAGTAAVIYITKAIGVRARVSKENAERKALEDIVIEQQNV